MTTPPRASPLTETQATPEPGEPIQNPDHAALSADLAPATNEHASGRHILQVLHALGPDLSQLGRRRPKTQNRTEGVTMFLI